MCMRLNLTLPLDAGSASTARHSIDGLAGELDDALFEDLRLLVTEVVTNSIRHARSTSKESLRLRLDVSTNRVRVEVVDHGPGFAPASFTETGPHVETPQLDSLSGRGLFLVEQIADRWGVSLDGATRVWFEIDR